MIEPVVIVHGGAGYIPDSRAYLRIDGVKQALKAGYDCLTSGGSVLDAVEHAIKVMEDDVAFNAGRGSVLNIHGTVEMDAIIMDGSTLKFGAVAGVNNISNPVSLARLVMESTPHAFLTGAGANEFARKKGVPFVDDDEIITDYARQLLDDIIHGREEPTIQLEKEKKYGTIGAVAVDKFGRVACATSTGGTPGKLPGRVGDTPVVGSGGYCDDTVGGSSATGHGESIARVCLCRHITGLMQSGLGPQKATEEALLYMKQRTGDTAGAITLSKKGEVGIYFTTQRMIWGYTRQGKLYYGISPGDNFMEAI